MDVKEALKAGIIGGIISGIISFVINFAIIPVPVDAIGNGIGNGIFAFDTADACSKGFIQLFQFVVKFFESGQFPVRLFAFLLGKILFGQVGPHGAEERLFKRTERDVEGGHRAQLAHHRAPTGGHQQPQHGVEAALQIAVLRKGAAWRLDG